MKALRFESYGVPSVLTVLELPKPEPHAGEVLIEVKAAAVNPSDVKNVAGHFKTALPRVPGRDYAGVVVGGDGQKGLEVWGSGPGFGVTRDGSHAQYFVIPSEWVAPKPAETFDGTSRGDRRSLSDCVVGACDGWRSATWRNGANRGRFRRSGSGGYPNRALEKCARDRRAVNQFFRQSRQSRCADQYHNATARSGGSCVDRRKGHQTSYSTRWVVQCLSRP